MTTHTFAEHAVEFLVGGTYGDTADDLCGLVTCYLAVSIAVIDYKCLFQF